MSPSKTGRYTRLVAAGQKSVMDIVAQANNLAVTSWYEEQALSRKQDQKWPASAFTLRALRTSAALMQFMALEGIANFMAALAISISNDEQGAPPKSRALHTAERDFLMEEATSLDPRTGNIITRPRAFSTSLDRLTTAPRLLGAIVGDECIVQKGEEGWQLVRNLKGFEIA